MTGSRQRAAAAFCASRVRLPPPRCGKVAQGLPSRSTRSPPDSVTALKLSFRLRGVHSTDADRERGAGPCGARPVGECDAVGVGAPSGTVTFLFTDIETSTALWESDPDSMRVALEGHDEALRAAVDAHGGTVFATGGDGFAVEFARATDVVAAAVEAQVSIGAWRVRCR